MNTQQNPIFEISPFSYYKIRCEVINDRIATAKNEYEKDMAEASTNEEIDIITKYYKLICNICDEAYKTAWHEYKMNTDEKYVEFYNNYIINH